MRIAVDAMGGDLAPDEIVKGASLAAQTLGVEILLVGQRERVEPILADLPSSGIEILHASDVVEMQDLAIRVARKRKDTSIAVAVRSVKEGRADALVSAGSTGATMVAALLGWGRIRGVDRPAIGTVMPTGDGRCVLLDAGAHVDAKPNHLVQYGIMGSAYAERVLGIPNPRVGLLNIGEEETKGCELVRQVYPRLRELSRINFIGNVEGRDILSGNVDVIICDGFVGNIVLKFAEGMAKTVFFMLQQALSADIKSRFGGLLLKDAFRSVRASLDYSEYGGAPLLGVDGICIISHGSSNAQAIFNAIRVAKEAIEQDLTSHIRTLVTART
ncbi:MAG: phosphate acyltransferase PlsX [Limnochordia bacterium]